MTTYHQNIPDQYLHEPKGVVTAVDGAVYVADGLGSGNWVAKEAYVNGFIPFDAVTPAYQHSVTTLFTALNPTFSLEATKNFVGVASPNSGLKYTGSEDIVASFHFSFNFKNASGGTAHLEVSFYRNGTPMNGGHAIITAQPNVWRQGTLSDLVTVSQNDLIEVMVKSDVAFDLDIAGGSLIVVGEA